MANLAAYCEESLGEIERIQCDEVVKGGIIGGVVFGSKATTVDYTDASQINADIAADRAWVIPDAMIDMPLPSEKAINHPVTNRSITAGYDRTLNIQDWNVTEKTADFYNTASKKFSATAILLRNFDSRYDWLISDTEGGISLNSQPVAPLSNGEYQMFQGTASWSSIDAPALIPQVAGINGL